MNTKQQVEFLARACRDFKVLVEKLQKTTDMDEFDILYNMEKYEMVVDGQEALDEAIKHNGRKLVMEFVLSKCNTETIPIKAGAGEIVSVFSPEYSIEIPYDRPSCGGTLEGRSYGLPSQGSICSGCSGRQLRVPKRYSLGRLLGRGSLGSVYIADDKRGKNYAVKIIKKNGKHLPQEADVQYLKKLRHPRIVEYLFIIEPEGSNEIHILMEHMHSKSLKEYIERHAPLSHKLVKNYTKQILEGLQFLHSNNIIHQDLKPANLLLKNDDKETLIKIADFGSSRFASLGQARGGTQGGTPKYTDPYVSLGRGEAGQLSDIWSLGVIVIEMYTGKYPWNIEREHPITVPRILDEVPPSFMTTEKVDEELVKLARSMLSPVALRPNAQDLLEFPGIYDYSDSDKSSDSEEDYY